MTRIANRILCAALFAATLPFASAVAGPQEDYVAARDKAIADSIAAAKAQKSGDDAVIKREEAARKDLAKKLAAALGPLKFKGLGGPEYSLQLFIYDESAPTRQLDGLAFASKDYSTRLVVAPESQFQAWLAARAKDPEAPAALAGGVKPAMTTSEFYGDALGFENGYFQPYIDLPVTAPPGETAFAVLGQQLDDVSGNSAPNELFIVRIADGKAIAGVTGAKLAIKPIPACDAVWKPFKAKADALQKQVEKDNKNEDPRWEEITKIQDEGSVAYRACFAKEAPAQPFFAAAVKKAEAFLATTRGQ
ncbi:hypothetical protein V5F49_07745 [Xanthobacter sp. V3C-3]|uniref:hypothetical protein n=1 Tax=Xanthobacter lutulentifluminis TaxID=3119935 RepID=UPI003728ACBA